MLMLRRGWLICLCLGCHSLAGVEPEPEKAPANELWQEGQAAMRQRQPEEAIRLYRKSLELDASLTCNYLSLAAAYLECGKEEAACDNLGKYLEHHPEHLAGRAHYAELLFKLRRTAEARAQFARFTVEAQETGDAPSRMIHAVSRLMEIAAGESDAYEEHLNRGIGLYLLACRRAVLADPDGDLPASGLLWKAVCELRLAHELRPGEARPCWYLYSTWRALGQHQPAQRWLRCTLDKALFSSLNPAEQRSLHLAGQCLEKRL
jgi:tetratricopeptide (TPR) repeat protein